MQTFNMPKKRVKESSIENYLYRRCKEHGWLCEKFTSPARRSVPDRIVTIPGRVIFIEVKAPGKKPTKLQYEDHKRRKALGVNVLVVDTKEKVNQVITMLENTIHER